VNATPEQRLRRRLRVNGECWEWTGCLNSRGRPGSVLIHGRTVSAIVLAHEVWKGPVPDRINIRQICDNTLCINPGHLLLLDTPGRLWSRVQKCDGGGCWDWQGPKQNKGYGILRHNNRDQLAHRVAYELTYGPIPAGMEVMHQCDRPSCCRPDHLQLGTHAENMAQMAARGRANTPPPRRGETNNKARLTDAAVLDIRARYQKGNGPKLAAEYGVTNALICMIVKRQIWKHLP
jgi:hypothetical protein